MYQSVGALRLLGVKRISDKDTIMGKLGPCGCYALQKARLRSADEFAFTQFYFLKPQFPRIRSLVVPAAIH